MTEFIYKPQGICQKEIKLIIEDYDLDPKTHGSYHHILLEDIEFTGGCPGQNMLLKNLVINSPSSRNILYSMHDYLDIFRTNTCGTRKTSCAQELIKAFEACEKYLRSLYENRSTKTD